jgi:hypothetical protein
MKQRADGTRVRVWNTGTLGVLNGNPEHDAAANITLKAWLDNSPIYLELQ